MNSVLRFVIPALWLLWGIYWFSAARDVKPTLRRESTGARWAHLAPLIACALLFLAPRASLPDILAHRFLPPTMAWYWLGVVLAIFGIAFAVWARRHLGRNWSGVITLKAGHSLIQSGPYGLVRHPIYSGLLLAMLGTAVASGDWRGLLAFALALVAILLRVRSEDSLMAATFGDEYAGYRRHTRALVPFIL